MSQVRISVAMTTYNGEQFLREQLDSLYAQTMLPYEVLVGDDGSTDGTIAILEEYKQSKGLKYIVNKTNLGVNLNFYNIIASCTGDYVSICDQDDIWLPNKIEVTYNKMKEIDNGKPSVVSTQRIDINAQGKIIKHRKSIKESKTCADTLLTRYRSQGCTMMLNQAIISKIHKFQDYDCIFDASIAYVAALIGNKYNLKDKLIYYRRHSSNVIGKANEYRPGFLKRRIDRLGTYPLLISLISKHRYQEAFDLYDIFKDEATQEAKELILILRKIDSSPNLLVALRHLYTIKNIPISKKIFVTFNSFFRF